jgi:hypothetical protein
MQQHADVQRAVTIDKGANSKQITDVQRAHAESTST